MRIKVVNCVLFDEDAIRRNRLRVSKSKKAVRIESVNFKEFIEILIMTLLVTVLI